MRNETQWLRAEANNALRQGPLTIVEKQRTPPSGDKRDYMSQGPYWWANPDTPDGLPYIRRDGELNPESETFDRQKLKSVTHAIDVLALAWYFFDDSRYADHAVKLLRVFLLDEATGMRPHLEYGQAIPGICTGRGIGIIETVILAQPMVDAISLLKESPSLSSQDYASLQGWFSDYLDWLLTSSHGVCESKEHNNHGTAFDLQVCAMAMFTDQTDIARETLSTVFEKRIKQHIEPDGRQPHELSRTRALSYATYNLQLLFGLAAIGDKCSINLWNAVDETNRGLRVALDWLIPYWTQSAPFPYQQIVPFDYSVAEYLLYKASCAYDCSSYEEAARNLPAMKQSHRWNRYL